MDRGEKLARQVAVRVASGERPLMKFFDGRASGNRWDSVADLSSMVMDVVSGSGSYDHAASFSSYDGSREAAKIVKETQKLEKMLKAAWEQMGDVAGLESQFVKKFGSPEDVVDKMQDKFGLH